jgi:hypothetical protein
MREQEELLRRWGLEFRIQPRPFAQLPESHTQRNAWNLAIRNLNTDFRSYCEKLRYESQILQSCEVLVSRKNQLMSPFRKDDLNLPNRNWTNQEKSLRSDC